MKERKRFMETEIWKCIRTVIEIILIALAVWGIVRLYAAINPAVAEEWDEHEEEYEIAYAICAKGDHVNIRRSPGTGQEPSGRLEPGDIVHLDGQKRNGYVHIVGVANEDGEGWVHRGYLVSYPPELVDRDATVVSNGKLAARKNVGGKRTRWLKPGGIVHVWYMAQDWCCTNCGYVMTKHLELEGE